MMVAPCPEHGPTLIDYRDLLALVNIEPGVIVMHWTCPCGAEHLTATGRVAEHDPVKAAAAVDAVRRTLRGVTPDPDQPTEPPIPADDERESA
ncbi:MAG: hypothetical protein ACSLEW_14220 [Nocardioides sp.]